MEIQFVEGIARLMIIYGMFRTVSAFYSSDDYG